MLKLSTGNTVYAQAGTGSAVAYTVSGVESSGPNLFKILAQGTLGVSPGLLYTVPLARNAEIQTILLSNSTNATVSGILLFINGSSDWNQIATLALPPYGSFTFGDGAWSIYDSSGSRVS